MCASPISIVLLLVELKLQNFLVPWAEIGSKHIYCILVSLGEPRMVVGENGRDGECVAILIQA